MAKLGDLVQTILPLARPIGATSLEPARAEREVTWVRVLKARVPAFDALEPGDLAIIPGQALAIVAPNPHEIDELAAALARARVPAVLIVEGDGDNEAVDALGRAASDAGVAVLRIGRADPVALERSVIGFLVNRRAELDRRAAELEGQLARRALLGGGLDVLAAAIGTFLGRAVLIEGRRGDRIAVHVPTDLPGAAAAVSRYLADPTGAALRVTIPAPAGDAGADSGGGRLVLLGETPATEFERIASERIAAMLALELARDAAVRQAREETGRGDTLPADGPPWVVLLARQAAADRPDDIAVRERTRAELRRLAPPRRLALRGTSESLELRLVVAAPADDPVGLEIATRIAGFVERTVSVSRPFGEPGERPAAEAAARTTLEAVEAFADPPKVALAARLPAYLLLGSIRNLPDGIRQARELLGPILVGRQAAQDERLATLQAVLDTGSLGEAAASLGVHRNTVAYRVTRMEELAGWDLADPDLRFALSLAARVMRQST